MTYAVSCIVTLCSNYLPNPGRSKAQRRLAIGSSRTVSQAAAAVATSHHACLTDFEEVVRTSVLRD